MLIQFPVKLIVFTKHLVGMEDRMMMSPDLWRKWFKPRMAKIIGAIREVNSRILVWYHSDGYIEPIIPDLIEIGINVLNPSAT